jgi:hypothetical protein
MGDAFAARHGGLAQYHFHWTNLAASATNTDGLLDNITGISLAVMLKAGSVVGLSATGSAVVTGDDAVFSVHSNGTELTDPQSPQVTLDTTTTNYGYDTARPQAVRFAAGDKLGVSVTTAAGFLPDGTAEFIAVLFVQFDPE